MPSTPDPALDPAFRFMFASNPVPMYVYDLATLQFLEVNTAAVEQYGYTRDEFLGMCLTDIRPPEDLPRLRETLERLAGAPASSLRRHATAWRHRVKDGRVRDVDIVSSAIEFGGRRAALVVATDVTELRQAQDALGKYARRLDILHEIDRAGWATSLLRPSVRTRPWHRHVLSTRPRARRPRCSWWTTIPSSVHFWKSSW